MSRASCLAQQLLQSVREKVVPRIYALAACQRTQTQTEKNTQVTAEVRGP